MTDKAIRVENLGKCYQIYNKPNDRLKQSIYPRLQGLMGKQPSQYYREFWALKDVSFEVKKGETIGIIGRNGSGKSTLLQLICGTLAPTYGSVTTKGRIAALLELGSGFNPEFTGRENVYMNGAIIGLKNEEIDKRFGDIATFADIGDFIEQSVKTYSSGMMLRLAFAVSVCVEPDILIIDEALAVGDMNFQAKCMTALSRIQERGTTILFVSHDVGSVKSICSRGIYLEQGEIKSIGNAPDVAEQYVRTMHEELNAVQRKYARVSANFSGNGQTLIKKEVAMRKNNQVFKRSEEFGKRVAQFRYGTGEVRATFVDLLDLYDAPLTIVEFNQKVKIRVFFEAYTEKSISVNVSVLDSKKNNITGCSFRHLDYPYLMTKSGGKYLAVYVFQLPLQEGNYSLRINIASPIVKDESSEFIDFINDAVVFKVGRWQKARVWSQVHQFAQLELMELK